jgi:hypothetical protein
VRWNEGYYCNASSFRDGSDLAAFASKLRPSLVVTLGNKAQELTMKALAMQLWPACIVHFHMHPMAARRFHFHDDGQYHWNLAGSLGTFVGPPAEDGPGDD